jgi:hypothetical protein
MDIIAEERPHRRRISARRMRYSSSTTLNADLRSCDVLVPKTDMAPSTRILLK